MNNYGTKSLLSHCAVDAGYPRFYGSREEAIKLTKKYSDSLRFKADRVFNKSNSRALYSAVWAINQYLDILTVCPLDDPTDILEGFINDLSSAMLRSADSKKMYSLFRSDINILYDLMNFLVFGITEEVYDII